MQTRDAVRPADTRRGPPCRHATRSALQTRDAVRHADTRRGPPADTRPGPPCRHRHATRSAMQTRMTYVCLQRFASQTRVHASCHDCVLFSTAFNWRIHLLSIPERARDPLRAESRERENLRSVFEGARYSLHCAGQKLRQLHCVAFLAHRRPEAVATPLRDSGGLLVVLLLFLLLLLLIIVCVLLLLRGLVLLLKA